MSSSTPYTRPMAIEKKKTDTPVVYEGYDYKPFIIKIMILIGFVIVWFLLYQIGTLIGILFFAFFFSLLFSPFLRKMNRYKIPDWLGVIFIYLVLLLFILTVVFAIVPIFLKQISALVQMISTTLTWLQTAYGTSGVAGLWLPLWLEHYLEDILSQIDFPSLFAFLQKNFSTIGTFIGQNASSVATKGATVVANLTSTVFGAVLMFVFTFFIVLERVQIRQFFYDILPQNLSQYMESKEERIIAILHDWIKGQAILGLSIFALTFIGLIVLRIFGIKIDNTFTLALIAGLMEFIPYIGPFLALLPALAIALGISFPAVIAILILYIIIQQTENNVLVPMVMSRTLDLSPFLVLLMMTLGASLAGVIGIIVAIPVAAILQLFVRDALARKKRLTKKSKTI